MRFLGCCWACPWLQTSSGTEKGATVRALSFTLFGVRWSFLVGLPFLVLAGPAWGQYAVDVPLTQGKAAVAQFLKQHAGGLSGGKFDKSGWTTTSRNDRLWLALPSGINTSWGRLEIRFSSPELSGPKGYFESYHLVALAPLSGPHKPTKAGEASLSTVYIAYRETGELMAQARAYFNLGDSSCQDWKLCTAEVASKKGWLGSPSSFVVVQDWKLSVNDVAFEPGGGKKQIDLSATSKSGKIVGSQFYIVVNPCGGSSHNSCGLWGGSTKGGPLGVRYERVRLTLTAPCGDALCDSMLENAVSCPADCAGDGVTASDAGSEDAADAVADATDSNGSGIAAGAGGLGGAGSRSGMGGALSTAPVDDGGCQCRLSLDTTPKPPVLYWLLGAIVLLAVRRRR